MSMPDLDKTSTDTAEYFTHLGFEVDKRDKYPAWKPEKNDFTILIDSTMREVIGESKLGAIHAGLECGVLKQKYPHILFASIGPTILYPHSTREMVNVDSVERIFGVVETIIHKI
jgi:dipeptidase D